MAPVTVKIERVGNSRLKYQSYPSDDSQRLTHITVALCVCMSSVYCQILTRNRVRTYHEERQERILRLVGVAEFA